MIKTFTTLALSLLAVSALADSSTPEFVWGNIFDGQTTAGDQATAIDLAGNGNLYSFFTAGSKTDLPDVFYAGDLIFQGSEYEGTRQNNNLTLIKTDNTGKMLWVVYSNSGDFANNSGTVCTTPDGGAVIMTKVRHTDGFLTRNIALVDATGATTEVDWKEEGTSRHYRPIFIKVSAEGAVEWVRLADLSTAPTPAATRDFISDAFNIGKGDVDSEGNFYVPFNYSNTITFQTADGEKSFECVNNKSWTGDSQYASGDWMIAKFDKDGYFLTAQTLNGEAVCTYAQNVIFDNGNLYLYGYSKGNEDTVLTYGDATFRPSVNQSPIIMKTTTDFDLIWGKGMQLELIGGKQGLQNCGLTVNGDALWYCGMFNGKIVDGENSVASTQGNLREGFIIRLNSETGGWVNQADSRDATFTPAIANTAITGYMQVLANPTNDSKIWVFGYGMNMNVGTFVRQYDAETLTADVDCAWNLVTQGGVPTCQAVAYDPQTPTLYCTTRGNKAFQPMGGELSDAPTSWGIYLTRFDLPADMASGVGSVETLSEILSVRGGKGMLTVNGSEGKRLAVYDLSGRLVVEKVLNAGDNIITLPAGFYLVEGQKAVVR